MIPFLLFLGEFVLALLGLFIAIALLVCIAIVIGTVVVAIKGGKFINGQFKKAEDRTHNIPERFSGSRFPF